MDNLELANHFLRYQMKDQYPPSRCPDWKVFKHKADDSSWDRESIPPGSGNYEEFKIRAAMPGSCAISIVIWWDECENGHEDDYQRRLLNGYFGCEDLWSSINGSLVGHVSWMRALVKYMIEKDGKITYGWHKMNYFVHWLSSTKQVVLLVFDASDELIRRIPEIILREPKGWQVHDPFWVYPRLLDLVIRFQNTAVWAVRGSVRDIEKIRPVDTPKPNYPRLHELARHAIHICETLDTMFKTTATMTARHKSFIEYELASKDAVSRRSSRYIEDRLIYFENMLFSLKARSASNKERLFNEIGLTFNTVAQYDSSVSVDISRATQADSNAMKTIAVLTLAFLPSTFISALFSMSFFDYDSNSGEFAISDKFWLFWVFAIPVTALTTFIWWFWTFKGSSSSASSHLTRTFTERMTSYV